MKSTVSLLRLRVGAWIACAALFACNNGSGTTQDVSSSPDATDESTTVDDTVADAVVADSDPTLLPDGAPNPCLGASSCDECTSRTPCGWCNGQCLAGEAPGSYDGTCSGGPWQYYGDQCEASSSQCPMHTDCASCAADENGCGWCTNSHQCSSGGTHGPSSAIDGCTPAAGTWIYSTATQTCP